MERERKTREREQKGKQKETDRGVKTIFIACASLTSAYAYQCGLVVWAHPALLAHPASSTAINLPFPTSFIGKEQLTVGFLLTTTDRSLGMELSTHRYSMSLKWDVYIMFLFLCTRSLWRIN